MHSSKAPTSLIIGDDASQTVMTTDMNPKQQLALTIKNWANNPANDENLINEGAIEALNSLSVVEDGKVKKR